MEHTGNHIHDPNPPPSLSSLTSAIVAKAGWDESKHKRNKGKFTPGGLGQTSAKPYLDAQKPRQSSYAQMESDSYEARNGHKRPRDMREHE